MKPTPFVTRGEMKKARIVVCPGGLPWHVGVFAYYSWVCGPISEPSRLQGGETPEHTRNSHGWSHRAK